MRDAPTVQPYRTATAASAITAVVTILLCVTSPANSAVNPVFYPLFVKANSFTASDVCIGCGKCEKLCPLNNITLQNARPVWGTNCTQCMACICYCPTRAIEYGKKSAGKPRYHFEEL